MESMKKVLIVEDHADMRELLSWQVELMGFVPVPAKHGQEGVEKALAEKPQLILLDIMMPGMDGCEAARLLRAHPDTQSIPILATTALFRDADLKNCLEAGCNGYIVKPFTFQELQVKLREFIPSVTSSVL
jgi:CheY-like chemotaxis protein